MLVGNSNTITSPLATTQNYVFGRSNDVNAATTAVGNNYIVGYANTASGRDSFAFGSYNNVSGPTSANNSSLAVGRLNTISNTSSYAFGAVNTVAGSGSYAIGKNITVNAANAMGINVGTTAVTLDTASTIALMGGNVGIGTTTPGSKLSVVGLPVYLDNAAAMTGGLIVGDFYRTGDGIVKVVY